MQPLHRLNLSRLLNWSAWGLDLSFSFSSDVSIPESRLFRIDTCVIIALHVR